MKWRIEKLDIKNLKKIRELVGIEISSSLDKIGTEELYNLCEVQERLNRLIRILDEPDYIKKVNKSMTLGTCMTGGIRKINNDRNNKSK